MDIGYSYLGMCYSSEEAARDANCAQGYPQQGSNSEGSYAVSCVGSEAGALHLVRFASGAASSASTLGVTYASCGVQSISNTVPTPNEAAVAFAWGVQGVFGLYLVAWGCGRVLSMIGWK